MWVLSSAIETWRAPILNDVLVSACPYMPGAIWTPYTSAATLTFVPDFQYCCGRKWTFWSSIQYQLPGCDGDEVTFRCFSAAALFEIASSKWTLITMPTP